MTIITGTQENSVFITYTTCGFDTVALVFITTGNASHMEM